MKDGHFLNAIGKQLLVVLYECLYMQVAHWAACKTAELYVGKISRVGDVDFFTLN